MLKKAENPQKEIQDLPPDLDPIFHKSDYISNIHSD